MSEQHDKFLKRLGASSPAVLAVAAYYHGQGRLVEIPPISRAPVASEAENYVDEGDLSLLTRHRVEVKGLNVKFSSSKDWPFREIFISNVASVDRANGKVSAYISVSSDLRCAAIVKTTTTDHWYKVKVKASNTGNMEDFYACPVGLAVFVSL
jgi:hypothetical protein